VADDFRSGQGQAAGGLGKDPVETDHHANGRSAGGKHGKAQIPGCEDRFFVQEKMDLAIDLTAAVWAEQD